jgi:hypothetical protein
MEQPYPVVLQGLIGYNILFLTASMDMTLHFTHNTISFFHSSLVFIFNQRERAENGFGL